jgi:ergothioneine biosynthesis protein EgtB
MQPDFLAVAHQARAGSAADLTRLLPAARAETLALFGLYRQHLPDLAVPQQPTLNPPLWELGHIGWFQDAWLGRNPHRARGVDADPTVPRHPPYRPNADALYDSSAVPHATRWALPLPDAEATVQDLARQLQRTLALLADLPPATTDERALYFFRLALLHEDMHQEAALYMAQALDLPADTLPGAARWALPRLPPPGPDLALDGGPATLGHVGPGFAFDNELQPHPLTLAPYRIAPQVLRWAEFLPFVEAGGYRERRWWTDAGWAWREAQGRSTPRLLRGSAGAWELRRWGRWQPLVAAEPACQLSAHEAAAWCAWAGRRLPTEAEWEHAATAAGPALAWGAVWEWTASPFAPYPGFTPHPYRDYSAPWFDGRPVLRGASVITEPRMRWPRYRNFFEAGRDDVWAGVRHCALQA